MSSQQEIENKLRSIKPFINKKFSVNRIGYFGSYARNEQTSQSDIDILVEFAKPVGWEFFDLQKFLEQELHHKIDLVTAGGLKQQLKELILKQVKYV
jgi:uncharacterized protein